MVDTWNQSPIPNVTGYSLLTPNTVNPLTTIAQLGGFTINEVGSLTLTQGYIVPSGTVWTKT